MSRRKTHPQFDSDEYIRRIEKARAEYIKETRGIELYRDSSNTRDKQLELIN